jgi:hypothetical protein
MSAVLLPTLGYQLASGSRLHLLPLISEWVGLVHASRTAIYLYKWLSSSNCMHTKIVARMPTRSLRSSWYIVSILYNVLSSQDYAVSAPASPGFAGRCQNAQCNAISIRSSEQRFNATNRSESGYLRRRGSRKTEEEKRMPPQHTAWPFCMLPCSHCEMGMKAKCMGVSTGLVNCDIPGVRPVVVG